MKKTALQISSVIGFLVLILMATVSAQAQTHYRAHIPGEYVVDMVSSDKGHKVVVIRDAKGRNPYLKLEMPGEGYSNGNVANLVFNRFEAQYALVVISTPSHCEILKIKS